MPSFFKSIASSIYNPSFYAEVLKQPFSFSLKYFYKLAALLALLYTIIAAITFGPQAQGFLKNVSSRVLNYYPENLEIKIEKGMASTNMPEPYTLPWPSELPSSAQRSNRSYANLLIIDTQTPFSIDQFKRYDTLAWLLKDSLVVIGDNEQIRIQGLEKFPNTTLTKSKVQFFVNKVEPFLRAVTPLLVIMIFIALLFFFSFQLVYLLFGALVIWIAVKIKKYPLMYGKAYQVGLHAITLPLLVNALWYLTGIKSGKPFLFTLLLVIVVFLNIRTKQPQPIESVSSFPTS